MKYVWNYLCSDPRRLSLTLRLLPRTAFEGLDFMRIGWCSHLDPADRDLALNEVASNDAPDWLDWTVDDWSELRQHLPEGLSPYWSTGKARWSLGVKLLLPFMGPQPYLYTDDDVIVSRDPCLSSETRGWGSKGCFRLEAQKSYIAEELFEGFNLVDAGVRQTYNAHALDAGVWFDPMRFGAHDWRWCLQVFARLPYHHQLTTRNLELRCLDQRFLTTFGIRNLWEPRTIGNGFAPPRVLSERTLTRHPFFHYKSSSKERWMTVLEAYVASQKS